MSCSAGGGRLGADRRPSLPLGLLPQRGRRAARGRAAVPSLLPAALSCRRGCGGLRGCRRRGPPRGQARAAGPLAIDRDITHVIFEDLDAASATSFFAVFDGLGGPAVAKYCAKHLHIERRANEEFHSNLGTAVQTTFLRMDEMLRNRPAGKDLCKYGGRNGQWDKYKKDLWLNRIIPCAVRPVYEGPLEDGCTACVALISGNIVVVGNAGDSRCIISRNGQAMDLSTDHKPNVQAETERITNAGHLVTSFLERGGIPRVDNGIAIARAIGDLRYKDNADLSPQQQAVTAFPDIRTEVLTDDTEFLFMACDGIWDCMSSRVVVNFAREHQSNIQPVGHQVTRFRIRGNIFCVDNGIAIARAIGDLRYKDNTDLPPQQQAVTAFSDEVLTDDTEFLFMACDGIWDCMSSQEVVNFVRAHPDHIQPVAICEALLNHCLAQPRGRDNMTALLVWFKRPVQPAIARSVQPPPPQQLIQASAAMSGTGTGQTSSSSTGAGYSQAPLQKLGL